MERGTFISTGLKAGAAIIILGPTAFSETPSIDEIIHRDYGEDEERSRTNNQYLIDNSTDREDLQYMLTHQDKTKSRIARHLSQHGPYKYYLTKSGIINIGHKGVYELNPRQLARIYLLLDALDKGKFNQQVMEAIQEDLDDPYERKNGFAVEGGGLIKLDDGSVELFPVLSTDATKIKSYVDRFGNNVTLFANYNSTYRMPEGTLDIPHLFDYHLHATQDDNARSALPSWFLDSRFIYGIGGDIGFNHGEIIEHGEHHSVVMTKLKGDNFNVSYYGGEKDGNGEPKIIVLNLGDWAA